MAKISVTERNWPFAVLEVLGIVLALAALGRIHFGRIESLRGVDVVMFSTAALFGVVGAVLFYRQNRLETEQERRLKDFEHVDRMAEKFNERERILNERAVVTRMPRS